MKTSLKYKIIYLASGLLVVVILAIMLLAPEITFRYEDLMKETHVQFDDIQLENKRNRFTISEKLKMYTNAFTYDYDSANDKYRRSETFISTEEDIPQEKLPEVLRKELTDFLQYFDQELYLYEIFSQISQLEESDITTSNITEISALDNPADCFTIWSVNFARDIEEMKICVNGTIRIDGVTGKIYSMRLDSYPLSSSEIETILIPDDPDILIRNLYQVSTKYLELEVDPANTSYSLDGQYLCTTTDHLAIVANYTTSYIHSISFNFDISREEYFKTDY